MIWNNTFSFLFERFRSVDLIHRNEICQSCKSMKLEFIRLDFTDLRYQRTDSIRGRLNLSNRAFHIRVRWQVAMTDRIVRLILREIDYYIQPSVAWMVRMRFCLKQSLRDYYVRNLRIKDVSTDLLNCNSQLR